MPMIITKKISSKYGPRAYAMTDTALNSASVKWNEDAHEEANHAAALRKLAQRLDLVGLPWIGASLGTKIDTIVWIAASGQRFTATT